MCTSPPLGRTICISNTRCDRLAISAFRALLTGARAWPRTVAREGRHGYLFGVSAAPGCGVREKSLPIGVHDGRMARHMHRHREHAAQSPVDRRELGDRAGRVAVHNANRGSTLM